MKTIKLFTGVAAMFLLTVTSCKKETVTPEQKNPVTEPTKEELLAGKASKTWMISGLTSDGKDLFGSLKACAKDDQFIFRADKTYAYTSGQEKCSSTEEDILLQGSWKFNDDYTKVIYVSNNETTEDEVVSLNATTLKTRGEYDGMTFEFTYTAK